jgi:hypothetical protein
LKDTPMNHHFQSTPTMRLLLAVSILAAVLSPRQAAAQTPVPVITCRVLCLDPAATKINTLELAGSKVVINCPLPSSDFSAPLSLPCPERTLTFYKPGSLHPPDAPTAKPAAVVKIPEGMARPLLLFVPVTTTGDVRFRVFPLEFSDQGFPKDASLVLNLYGANARFVLGEHQHALTPGQSVVVKRPAKLDNFNMSPVVFQVSVGEQWQTVSETMISFPAGLRHFFICFNDPASKRPKLASFRNTELH